MTDPSAFLEQVLINLVAAPTFVALVSLVPQPWRQRSMAVVLFGASTSYLTGGLGLAEVPFALAIAALAVAGWRYVPAIGVGWIVHAVSDLVHHTIGAPMVAVWPLSSFGCAVFDPLIAIWFLLDAPSMKQLALRWRATP
jgi:hypothetical protein